MCGRTCTDRQACVDYGPKPAIDVARVLDFSQAFPACHPQDALEVGGRRFRHRLEDGHLQQAGAILPAKKSGAVRSVLERRVITEL
jgi:hypothetical protein